MASWEPVDMEQKMAVARAAQSIDPVLLGGRLRTARLAAGLTQGQLAGGDVSPAYISRIEAGDRQPRLELLSRFARRVGVTVDELLAQTMTDPGVRLRAAVCRATVLVYQGHAATALVQVEEAIARQHVDAFSASLEDLRHAQAQALAALGRHLEARRVLERSLASQGSEEPAPSTLISLSELLLETGDLKAAQLGLAQAADLIERHALQGLPEGLRHARIQVRLYVSVGVDVLARDFANSALLHAPGHIDLQPYLQPRLQAFGLVTTDPNTHLPLEYLEDLRTLITLERMQHDIAWLRTWAMEARTPRGSSVS